MSVNHPLSAAQGMSRRQLLVATLLAGAPLVGGPASPVVQGSDQPGAAPANRDAAAKKPPRWFAYRCPYYAFDARTLRRFAAIGVNLVHISPLNTLTSLGVPYSPYAPSWVGPGTYDFAPVDRYIADVLAANPNARLLCGIDLNTPAWWPRALWSRRRIDSFCELGRVAASPEWRSETAAYLRAFLTHTETHHKARIAGYTLFCGMTLEWQDHSAGQESPSKRAAWRKWMIDQGKPDPVDIPPASVREHCGHGIFRDPVADAMAVDYWRFSNWLVGDAILYFAAAAQEVLRHRVPLGVFYGYLFEHGQGRVPEEGHLDFDRVFASPLLDFFMAPGSYHDRQLGGASGFMVCLHSVKHRQKGFVQELDHRTHTCPGVTLLGKPAPGYESGFPTRQATIAGLRREFALALIEGASVWWFNIFGHIYDDPQVVEAVAQMHTLWKTLAEGDDTPVAEVAVLADAESMYYLDSRSPLVNDFLGRQRHGLGRMGTPYEVYSFADLPALDLSRHKLILLPNLFVVNDTKLAWLREKVCCGGKTVVWVYAPGIISNGRYDLAHVQRLTGISHDAKDLTRRQMDGWVSVFSPQPNLPAGVLRRLAAEAGVHIYGDTEEPLYASRHLLAAHTATGGRRHFVLPRPCRRIRELFSNRVVAEGVSRFTDQLQAPDTVLYQLEG